VAAIGFTLGQTAIDIVLLVDRYAGWVSLSLIVLLFLTPSFRRAWSRWVGRRRQARGPCRPGQAAASTPDRGRPTPSR